MMVMGIVCPVIKVPLLTVEVTFVMVGEVEVGHPAESRQKIMMRLDPAIYNFLFDEL